MAMDPKITLENRVYKAPKLFVGIFYLLFAIWVVLCLAFLGSILDRFGLTRPFQVLMIVLILFSMCYFSTAIAHTIEAEDEGSIRLTSFRRTITLHAEDIALVEGPRVPIGFIKFRFEREKAYLFCLTNNASLKAVLSVIRAADSDIRFKNL